MRCAMLVGGLLVALVGLDCEGELDEPNDELCWGIDCSGHGDCAVVDLGRDVTCICDPSYIVAGLECIPTHPGDGDADVDSDTDVDTDVDSDSDSDGPCEPACAGRECGPDGCGGTCAPGCEAGWECDEATGLCECVPACEGRDCGLDPRCGELCGVCDGACCDGTCHPGGTCCTDEDCGLCEGVVTRCSATTDAFECDMRPGCYWNGSECAGTATPCDSVSDALSCSRQEGCRWSVCNSAHLCT